MSWRAAVRWPAIAARWSATGSDAPGRAGREPADEEAGVECVARSGRIADRQVFRRDLEPGPARAEPAEDGRALRTALDDGRRRDVQQPVDGPAAEERLRLGRGREQEVRGDVRDQLARRAATAGKQRTDRREINADGRAGPTGEIHGASAGQPERLAQERIDRQVECVGAVEPGRTQVVGRQLVRCGTVGHEAPLAARRDKDPDPARPCAGDPRHQRSDAVGPDGVDQGPTGRVATDRRDQGRSRPEPAQPTGRGGRRTALDQRHPTGHVRPGLQLAGWREHHVEHQIAEDDDARARGSRRPSGAAGTGRPAWPGDGRHPRRIAGRRLQWPDPSPRECALMTLATDLDQLSIDTIRTLSIDGVQKANSGHPGAPMGAAPMAYVLWTRFLRHAPTHPDWPNRDRFVLSAGHASMLLYSLLHLTGYAVSLEDLESFRQWGSITPGHPEYGLTPGVEATTGPLGQGFANAVGMAIAERRLAEEFNRHEHTIVDHRTYVIASDGDLQEGIASEAASLAGHLQLSRLIVLYDDNHIQLDGPTNMAWSEDVTKRFQAYRWHTQRVEDGNDVAAIEAAIESALTEDRPSLIAVRTHIGFGSPNKHDSQKAHGSPLGPDEVRLTKEAYGWDPDRTFYVPDAARDHFRSAVAGRRGPGRGLECGARSLRGVVPGRRPRSSGAGVGRRLPDDWDADLKVYETGSEVATRNASQDAINALAVRLPELFGGAADLSESNLTDVTRRGELQLRGGRPEPALRGPRARDGRHRQRDRVSRRVHPVLRDVPDLQRLHARQRPAGRPVRAPPRLRLDPRLGRARRGRPDPPAGRALRRAPGDPQPVVRPARRCQRDSGGLGARHRAGATVRWPSR